MSRSGQITLDWADGTYPFRLGIAQLAELQEKTDAGPWYIQWALQMALLAGQAGITPPKDASPAYVIDTIRLGLIGGGMDAVQALKKVRAYCGDGQLTENIPVAFAIMGTALQGVPEDEPEKPVGESETSANRSPEEESGSRKSTASELQSD